MRNGRVRLVDVVDWESSQFSDVVMREKGGRGLGVFFRINESSLCCDDVEGGVDGGGGVFSCFLLDDGISMLKRIFGVFVAEEETWGLCC